MNHPLQNIRINNIIDYEGAIRNDRYVRILAINHNEGKGTIYTLIKSYGDNNTFVASLDEMRPITLKRRHLEDIGFKQNNGTKNYEFNGLVLGEFSYSQPNNNGVGHALIDLGIRIVPNGFPALPTVEQVEGLELILYLHDLQNYCTDNGINGLNFSATMR